MNNPRNKFQGKLPEKPKTKKDVETLCTYWAIDDYKINTPDLTVDVYGNVDLDDGFLEKFPVNFGFIKGDFTCRYNKLTDLLGSPCQVMGDFNCDENTIYTLDGCPIQIMGKFSLKDNPIVQVLEIWRPLSKKKKFNCKIHSKWNEHCPVEKHGNNWYLNEKKFQELSIVVFGEKVNLQNISLEDYIILPEKMTSSKSDNGLTGQKRLDFNKDVEETLNDGYYNIKYKGDGGNKWNVARYLKGEWYIISNELSSWKK